LPILPQAPTSNQAAIPCSEIAASAAVAQQQERSNEASSSLRVRAVVDISLSARLSFSCARAQEKVLRLSL
jgi:hypothetical protein